ncbi:2OG-Fe(II) oxygenase family protein [Alteromonas gilva]|uniref:2OG-Fe(II) oxygenase n=1 Tax=Alteromonas gilva TaxID=2987522 RepID=A0ABT5L5J5_9ALTE|nr:putative 2OG-Fe(II) oxygenase [Alteromonas gilva]MDC8831669.1 putative 2OG-Fe(II) oxygenase [Alteromonas gilva]
MNPINSVLTLIKQQRFAQGITALDSLLKTGSQQRAVLHRLRATCFFALKQYPEAISDLNKANEEGMSDGELFMNLAKAYVFSNDLTNAFQYILKALNCKDRFYQTALCFVHRSMLDELSDADVRVLIASIDTDMVTTDSAKNALANIYIALSDATLALAKLDEIKDPAVDVRITYAMANRMNGECHKALDALMMIENDYGRHFAVYHQMANCYADLGDLDNACECYSKAIELNDQYRFSHFNLAELMFQRGSAEMMFSSYEALHRENRFNLPTLCDYLSFLLRLNHYPLVLTLTEYYRHQFGRESLQYFEAEAQRLAGHSEQAIQTTKAIDSQCLTNDQLCQLTQHLITNAEYPLAQAFLQQVLCRDETNQWALALAILLSHNDQGNSANHLNYIDYIFEYALRPPAGFDNTEAYLQALASLLNTLHGETENSPLNVTIHGGTQSHANLFTLQHPLIAHLKSEFEHAASQALAKCKAAKTLHAGFEKEGSLYTSGSWSINTKTAGYHNNHIHPMGLLSSVCYISLPADISAENGGIQFGVPPFATPFTLHREVFTPEIGKLLLFPSCFWHGTLPLLKGNNRLTVAADFVLRKAQH